MAHNTSISLGDHFQELSANLIAEGRYSSVSEVVRAGLRLLEEHERKVQALNQALDEGLASGVAEAFDFDEFLGRMHAKHDIKA
jgi:antitoxin ParD1/3/4